MKEHVKFGAGLAIIFLVILLRAIDKMEWQDAQILLGIAAALLGIVGLLRRNGK